MSLKYEDCLNDIPRDGLQCSCCEARMNPMMEGDRCESCLEYVCDECIEGDVCDVCSKENPKDNL